MLTADDIEKIRKMVNAGSSVEEVASEFGVSRGTLERRLFRTGWQFERRVALTELPRALSLAAIESEVTTG